jgi:hypothetical protein
MSSDIGVGDSELVTLAVAPADGTTQVTLTVDPPTGSSYEVTMTAGTLDPIEDSTDFTQRWTSAGPVTYDQPGLWVLHYEVTGTGEGTEDFEVYVVASPVAGGPTWLPGRSEVAVFIPHRTLVRSLSTMTGSADEYAWTWDSTTIPPGTSVDKLISSGAAWVTARVSPVSSACEALARTCVALFSAAMIERSWPQDDQALQRANDLERRLDVLLADLIAANNASNGTGDYGIDIAPVWSFPSPNLGWDYPSYF